MPRILILEDEPLIAAMMGDWLREMGCEVVGPAHNVGGALALLDHNEIDAAILDLSLQGSNCYPVAAALRGRGVPIAFATGHAIGTLAEDYRDAPILAKPFDFSQLGDIMKGLLSGLKVRSMPSGNPN